MVKELNLVRCGTLNLLATFSLREDNLCLYRLLEIAGNLFEYKAQNSYIFSQWILNQNVCTTYAWNIDCSVNSELECMYLRYQIWCMRKCTMFSCCFISYCIWNCFHVLVFTGVKISHTSVKISHASEN